MVQAGPGLCNCCGVAQHANGSLDFSQVPSWNNRGGLIVDAHLGEQRKKTGNRMTCKLAKDNDGQSVGNKLHWQALGMGVGWNYTTGPKEQGSWEHGQVQRVCAGEKIKAKGRVMAAHAQNSSTMKSEAGGSQELRN